jgi:hypothetical protein
VHAAGQAPLSLSASLSQQALMPSWIPRLAAVAMAVVAVVGAAFFFGLGPFAPRPTPTPSIVLVTQPPTSPPIEPPTQEGQPSQPAEEPAESTAPPEEEPPSTPPPLGPDDFSLSVAGDDGRYADILRVKCQASDTGCRDVVKDTVLAMITGLRNEYTGVGLTSTRSTDLPNAVPIAMSADRQFPWRQSEGGQAGTTDLAVVDLGPVLTGGYPYAVVNTPDGLPHRFLVDSGLAQQLFDTLYQVNEGMPSMEVVTLPPDLYFDVFRPVDLQPVLLNPELFLPTPAP